MWVRNLLGLRDSGHPRDGGKMMQSASAHLVAHLDTTQDPPVLKGFALYSSGANSLTQVMGHKELLVDVLKISERGENICYGDVKNRLVEYLRSSQCHLRHKGPAVLHMLEALLELEDREKAPVVMQAVDTDE